MLDIIQLRLDEIVAILTPIDEEKVEALMQSIREKGLISPVAINQDRVLVAGFHRLEAIRRLSQESPEAFTHIAVRIVDEHNQAEQHRLETMDKLFQPDLSILDKAEYFKTYFDSLKYGEKHHKTTEIFEKLDISRRTFFNLRTIAEGTAAEVRTRIRQLADKTLQNSMHQLLTLSRYDAATQMRILDLVESGNYTGLFEAIKAMEQALQGHTAAPTRRGKVLRSPSLKLARDLRDELHDLSRRSGHSQNELFNEAVEAGLELLRQKYI